MKPLICLLTLATSNLLVCGAAATRPVPDSKLVPLIAKALSDSFELGLAKLVLEPSRPLAPVTVPQDTANISIKLLNNPYTKPSSFMKAQYAILADGLPVAEHTSYFKAQLMQDVWVAQQVAQRGDLGRSQDRQNENQHHQPARRHLDWQTGQHFAARQHASPGVVLQERHLRRTPAVFATKRWMRVDP